MNKQLHRAAFVVGLVVTAWVAAGYLRSTPLALGVTLLIAAFFVMGALELRRFDQATAGLQQALHDIPTPLARLDDWLDRLPASLRQAVRLRIEGDRPALPGPALTPYLAGLLVLLGMLGTFLGMVATLNGTGAALQGATDLQTMRDSLATPVKGLGLAFGTSVAGVAASAMLGLMSALSRQARLQAAQELDRQIAGSLHTWSRAHQRQQSLQLLQQQAQLMPALVDRMQDLMAQLAAQSLQSGERLLASQQGFQQQVETSYRALAASVDQTLRGSLAESARIAAATIEPAVTATMQGIARETTALHGQIASTVQLQLDGLSERFGSSTQAIAEQWSQALTRHEGSTQEQNTRLQQVLDGFGEGFDQRSAAWLQASGQQLERLGGTLAQTVEASHGRLQQDLAAGDAQRLAGWTTRLEAMSGALQQQWQLAGEQTAAQQARICQTLEDTAGRVAAQSEAQARATIAEIARLVQAASEAPRAAAELVAQLREKIADSAARDSALVDERSRTLAALNTLLDAVQQTATGQKAAIDTLVASTATWLQEAGARFDGKVEAESARIESAAAQLGSSAVDMASLAEAFGAAVQLFGQTSERMTSHLQRLEDTLGRTITRSDEQLAYYVAQAREVIDLSISSQKQVVDDLQRIARSRAVAGSEA